MNMFDFQAPPSMRARQIYDRFGNLIEDPEHVMQGGDYIRTSLMLMDGQQHMADDSQAIHDRAEAAQDDYERRISNAWQDSGRAMKRGLVAQDSLGDDSTGQEAYEQRISNAWRVR